MFKLKFFRKITIWDRFDKEENRYKFNHIENGWQTKTIPKGHPSWKTGTWLRSYGWLDYKNRVQLGDPCLLIAAIIAAILAISTIWVIRNI